MLVTRLSGWPAAPRISKCCVGSWAMFSRRACIRVPRCSIRFLNAHQVLKDQFFLNPKEEDDDPYESSQITALIANPSGIYGVYSYREVFSFDRFWAIGSGRNFALGAMYASYKGARTAAQIATLGVAAGAEFDKSSHGPHRVHEIMLQDAGPAPAPDHAQAA